MSSRKVLILIIAAVAMLSSCSITRHVPDGQYLLDDVKIVVDDNETIKQADLINYLRQQPNHEVLGGMKLQLMVYNISGRDSTSRFNRWIRRICSAPVVYDPVLTDASPRRFRIAVICIRMSLQTLLPVRIKRRLRCSIMSPPIRPTISHR